MITFENGKPRYFDKYGQEITEGCITRYTDAHGKFTGRIKMNWVRTPQIRNGSNLAEPFPVSLEFIRWSTTKPMRSK